MLGFAAITNNLQILAAYCGLPPAVCCIHIITQELKLWEQASSQALLVAMPEGNREKFLGVPCQQLNAVV